jgi:ribosome-associated protein
VLSRGLQGCAFSHILRIECDFDSITVLKPSRQAEQMLRINDNIEIPESEIEMNAIRASGPGGQNVNKVASAIHLRFDSQASAVLPDKVKQRLSELRDRRISADGIINIKAQRSRSQDKNRDDALRRLAELLRKAVVEPTTRKKTRPGRKAKEKRLADKAHRAKLKQARGKIVD